MFKANIFRSGSKITSSILIHHSLLMFIEDIGGSEFFIPPYLTNYNDMIKIYQVFKIEVFYF